MKNWIHNNMKEDIVLSSKIRLARNLKDLPFPNKLNYIKGREIGRNIYNLLKNEDDNEGFTLYEVWNNKNELNREYMEKNLISKKLLKNSEQSSFIVNKDETISIMVNEEDHIRIQCMEAGLSLENIFNNAMNIDDKIERNINYAFDEQLGYLTSSPVNLGTGMKVSVMIHLPALTMSDEITNIRKNINKIGMDMKPLYLKDTKVYGNMYEIFNKVSLGITEDDIIRNLKNTILNVISEEKKFREILITKCKYELEDRVYRAYGILKSAVLLNFEETIDLISSVRLGIELSLIDMDKRKLNQLLIMVNDSFIESNLEKSFSSQELKYERAKIVKEILN